MTGLYIHIPGLLSNINSSLKVQTTEMHIHVVYTCCIDKFPFWLYIHVPEMLTKDPVVQKDSFRDFHREDIQGPTLWANDSCRGCCFAKHLQPGGWWKKSGDHQLRLVVYLIIYKVSYIPGGLFGISSINRMKVYSLLRPHQQLCGSINFLNHWLSCMERRNIWTILKRQITIGSVFFLLSW